MTQCVFERKGDCVCVECGRAVPSQDCDKVLANCRSHEKYKPATRKSSQGLGDKAEAILKAVGITPERYAEAKALFGLPPTCNCSKRKEWLNRVGEWWEHAKGKQ